MAKKYSFRSEWLEMSEVLLFLVAHAWLTYWVVRSTTITPDQCLWTIIMQIKVLIQKGSVSMCRSCYAGMAGRGTRHIDLFFPPYNSIKIACVRRGHGTREVGMKLSKMWNVKQVSEFCPKWNIWEFAWEGKWVFIKTSKISWGAGSAHTGNDEVEQHVNDLIE